MGRTYRIHLLDIIMAVSEALDLISPAIVDHHKRTAYIAQALGRRLGLSETEENDLLLAAALHDSGAFYLKERLDLLEFEVKEPHRHAEMGYRLLAGFTPLRAAATVVRYHHLPWDDGRGRRSGRRLVPRGSHILHLADRVSVLLEPGSEPFEQGRRIRDRVLQHNGTLFSPEAISAFCGLAEMEYFWLEAVSPSITSILKRESNTGTITIPVDKLRDFALLFHHLIDFRSVFTATHSSGVSSCARALASFCRLSQEECTGVAIAACLHDLGKLSLSAEILEKRAKLNHHEQVLMRGHPYHGFRILEKIPELSEVNCWANYHHERINGTGYPFHLHGGDLPLGSRIVAAADVFTALTENRPYRPGMNGLGAINLLQEMAGNGILDEGVVERMRHHFHELDTLRTGAQQAARKQYRQFARGLPATG